MPVKKRSFIITICYISIFPVLFLATLIFSDIVWGNSEFIFSLQYGSRKELLYRLIETAVYISIVGLALISCHLTISLFFKCSNAYQLILFFALCILLAVIAQRWLDVIYSINLGASAFLTFIFLGLLGRGQS